jgi:hypothetical protein
MPNKHLLMKLPGEEELFLRHWMYDEVRYEHGQGPAKRLRLENRAVPADLAVLIAAAIPDFAEQQAAGLSPPSEQPPRWPWTDESLRARLIEARAILAVRSSDEMSAAEVVPQTVPQGRASARN